MTGMHMQIDSIAISRHKRTRKQQIITAELVENHGLKGDAHAGDCIMPREGVFARVIRGGTIQRGDEIALTP